MLPDRKRMLKLWGIGIACLLVVIIGISLLTKYIKSDKTVIFVSDPYPEDYVYMGVQYLEDSQYEVISVLNPDFTKSDKSVNSYFKIEDLTVIDNKLVIYSDAINELAYESEEDRLFLSEVNSFYDPSVQVALAHDYIVYVTKDNSIYCRKYSLKDEEESVLVASNLTNKNIKVVGNIVYYRDFEGIVAYNLDEGTVVTIVPTDDNFSPYIEGGNNDYLLLRNGDVLFLYGFVNGQISYLSEKVKVKEDYKYLSLYNHGFLYSMQNPRYLIAYSTFFDKLEYSPYIIPDDLTIASSYCFDEAICYLDFVDYSNNHTYKIFDFKDNKTLATLEEGFQYIVKVKS